jgi:hypothetical protein
VTPTSESLCPLRYPLSSVSGTHNLSVYVDAGFDSFWYNISYTVADSLILSIGDRIYSYTDTRNYLSGTATITSTWAAYDNGTLVTSGTVTAGSFMVNWAKSTLRGLHEWGVLFTDGTTNVWVNGSYEARGILIIYVVIGQDNDSIYISGKIYSTDHSLQYWVFENTGAGNVLMGSGTFTLVATEAWFSVMWSKSSENAHANWTLIVSDGSNNSTCYGWYTKLDSAVTNIVNNASHLQEYNTNVAEQTNVSGDQYTGPSPEAAMWQTLGYIGLTFGLVFIIGTTYYATIGLKSRRIKRDRSSDWLRSRR